MQGESWARWRVNLMVAPQHHEHRGRLQLQGKQVGSALDAVRTPVNIITEAKDRPCSIADASRATGRQCIVAVSRMRHLSTTKRCRAGCGVQCRTGHAGDVIEWNNLPEETTHIRHGIDRRTSDIAVGSTYIGHLRK